MSNNSKNFKQMQQDNINRLDKCDREFQDAINIGVEDLEREEDKEMAMDEILTVFEPHKVRYKFVNPKALLLDMTKAVYELSQGIKNKRIAIHRGKTLEFVSDRLRNDDGSFFAGLMFGLGQTISTGKAHVLN